ncbi:hypothetical protein NUW58_g6248 [Xylaria curta]|uniref:Uncharacterized protein n=1 Tax=Xylaria curta TaxID=42375 RepID=A0ACC1NX41_9PEZI|nr:hypothetical protein NUW58_g6248 [Xylaria curta]
MGGLAFAPEVFTPRMPPDVYRAVRDRCQEKLRELFLVVATPIEGPAKTSFGDIDLFVAWRRDEVFPSARPPSEPHESTRDAIYRVLGATKCKIEEAMMLAIPWPSDFAYPNEETKGQSDSSPRENAFEGAQGSADNIRPPCIQVDVHVCGTLDKLQFMLFKHAHGDLWNILGSTIRALGLTIDEKALYIRIPEIEETDKKKARVPLSTDPSEILSFLGLSVGSKEWEQPFDGDWEVEAAESRANN